MVRSRGASWTAMRSLLRTGLWLRVGRETVVAGLGGGGAPEREEAFGRL